jgi:uncharacterized protein (TIGR02594 family)
MDTRAIQQALADLGFDPGPVDGIRGRQTIEAIRAFQAANGLMADGIAGPMTQVRLREVAGAPVDDTPSEPVDLAGTMPWMEEALRLLGTHEKVGPGSNQTIMDWADRLNLGHYTDDDIPWCGLFVGHCTASQLPAEPLPTNVLLARNWQRFGQATQPGLGAIMVFWRGSPSGTSGHVGFYWAEDSSAYHILGGNQSNAVTITRVGKDRLLGARWPSGVAAPSRPHVRQAGAVGSLSLNEA